MGKKFAAIMIIAVLSSMLLSSCSAGQNVDPTILPSTTVIDTLQPTATKTPQPTSTITPTSEPTTPFPVIKMSNPALNVTDIRVTVNGEYVTAVFYLQDVPEKLTFNRTGVAQYSEEYSWDIWIDTSNDLNTSLDSDGQQGSVTTYSLFTAANFHPGQNESIPIENGVHAAVALLSENGLSNASMGSIKVDPEANTITLSGFVPGVTPNSHFSFEVYDANPGGQVESSYGQLIDRVTFIDSSIIEPTVIEPMATKTLTPTTPFPVIEMSNPALNVTDLRVTVQGELMTAIFYLEDVPETMVFNRTGMEYS
ncbi:MAG: hypothetical protein NTZ74_04725 [Chloroflexi bacterium]|nr:hypothetical protein [Chloroflexota bacterium]